MEKIGPAVTCDPYEKSLVQPSMEKFGEFDFNQIKEEESLPSGLVSNGTVDYRGRIAAKKTTGGWKASPFIIVNEVAERLAFFAIGVNMVAYLVFEMRKSLPDAATIVTDWIGAAYVLTILGAFMADAYLGRFKTIVVFSSIYAVGMVLLTLSASIDSLRPPPCTARPCKKATESQLSFLYVALALVALGTGGIKPCVSSFGADQFDEADTKEVQKKYAFFNWFFFAINMGALVAITVLVYIQDNFGWELGFGIPTGALFCSIIVLLIGLRYYRYQKPMGSPFTRFLQVLVASLRNHFKGVELGPRAELYEVKTKESEISGARKLCHTAQFRFLDKSAVVTDPEGDLKNRWRLVTVTQVEEFKSFVRVLPIWAATIALSISFSQFSTFFISQATIMDRKLGPNFKIPAGSVPVFSAINALILVPIYEKIIIPILRKKTGHRRGITSLQRMGVGLFISIVAMASAALVETKRRNESKSPPPPPLSVFWLFPQFFLMGSAEVFTYVGQLEFFYDEATDVKIVDRATGGVEKGWLRNDLNKSRLDQFYWLLTAINGVNFLVYLFVAMLYKGRDGLGGVSSVRDEVLFESSGEASGRVGDLTMTELGENIRK
ncbi:Proton-dependent oligopeptide transporter [Parasponia andersonii]|uniref:Proton-dependent oligopeptide transporter n=1 Tax=Parasponia andersonii TaxID=3476 RepID=A0A2P5BT72_PARAD|nr:Proton-dependent oligopeptide transporter [Parasponia andersonii]